MSRKIDISFQITDTALHGKFSRRPFVTDAFITKSIQSAILIFVDGQTFGGLVMVFINKSIRPMFSFADDRSRMIFYVCLA